MSLLLKSLIAALLVTAHADRCLYNVSETSFTDERYRHEKTLPLIFCNITHIPQGMFKPIPQLYRLDLSCNLIAELKNSDFEGLESLNILDLSDNRLATLPDDLLHYMPSLTKFFVNNNPLTKISSNTLSGTNLTKLIIMNNMVPLTVESRAFAEMTRLKIVVLKNCGITTLPDDLFHGSNALEAINMADNYIKDLTADILANASSLVYLNLNNNLLSALPSVDFATLHSLRILRLEYNQITEIPAGPLKLLRKLDTLQLGGNRLRVVAPDAFPVTLETLSLGNELKTLETHPLPELTELFLNNNSLSSVPQHWPVTFPALRRLDLTNNTFTRITKSDMGVLSHYPRTRVDLSKNQIVTVLVELSTTETPFISLEGAPLRCDCLMHGFAAHLHDTNKVRDAYCSEPASLHGTNLTDVPLTGFVCQLKPCPDTCNCIVQPATKTLEVTCKKVLASEELTELESLREQYYSDMTQITTISYD